MSKKKYMAILVSEDGDTTRRFNVSQRGFRIVLTFAILITVVAIVFAIYVIPRAFDYDRLKSQHQTVMEERMKVASLIRDLNRIKEMNSRIQQALGIDLEFAFESEMTDSFTTIPPPHYVGNVPISYLDNIPSYVPVEGFITQEFYRSPLSQADDHLALDIAAKSGSPVHATSAGMVVFSGWTYQLGNLVIIFHRDGYFSLYGHNQQNLVRERQFVERGELIALVGESGIATGPHLHFEIWKEGQPVDPKAFIVEYRTQPSSVERLTDS